MGLRGIVIKIGLEFFVENADDIIFVQKMITKLILVKCECGVNIVCRGDSHLKKWLKIDDGVIFLRYICRKGCIINQKGLKFGRKKQYLLGILCMFAVTSFAEVWIEIIQAAQCSCHHFCHFLRGSVD